ncbi:MAG TPA: hypothetical protein VGM70_11095 [Pseudolysinimonas sp.]|jgi:hypothetical protein
MDADEFTQQVPLSDIPADVIEQAKAHPGGWVYELDSSMLPNPNGYVPGEAVKGSYAVGSDGVPTGEYRRNPKYGPITDDWSKLDNTDQWLGWIPGSPSAAVRRDLERSVADQIPGTRVEWVKILEDPITLVGGVRHPDNPEQTVVRRVGLAVAFAMSVVPPSGRREFLLGSFTWAAAGLDSSRKDRTWFDIGMPIEQASELLDTRIQELGE